MKPIRYIRKNILIILIILITTFIIYKNLYISKEGFTVGRTYVINENNNVCPAGKRMMGSDNKDISQTLSATGVRCDSGYSPIFSSTDTGLLFNCGKNIQVCDDGYNYNKNSLVPNQMCVNNSNSTDKRPVKNGSTCPLPTSHEIRIIDGPWCQIIRTSQIQCASGYTYLPLIQKCYKCV